ncbi:MAG: hypothetical protein GEU78_20065, partial [Actinobacteria bacterium]|nr:hypothetical protein [Actinomycetota bacterium]
SNLVPGDTNGEADAFVHDMSTGVTTRISVNSAGIQAEGRSSDPSISGDGRYLVFSSDASNLVADDTNGDGDIFIHDRTTGETTRVSIDSTGTQANNVSVDPTISANGEHVAFVSVATNLVADDSNSTRDVFVHDTTTGETRRVSVDDDGTEGDGFSEHAAISGNGRYVAFDSVAANLVPFDTNMVSDVFVHQYLPDPPPSTTTT